MGGGGEGAEGLAKGEDEVVALARRKDRVPESVLVVLRGEREGGQDGQVGGLGCAGCELPQNRTDEAIATDNLICIHGRCVIAPPKAKLTARSSAHLLGR